MARRTTRTFHRPAPKTKMWIGAGVGVTTTGVAGTTLVATLSAGALLLRSFTILRSRIELAVFNDQTAASETSFGTYGQIVVTEAAAAAGIGSIPNPSGVSGDPEADWYIWQAISARFINLTSVGFAQDVLHRYVIDSKAMRKVGPDDQVVSVLDNELATGISIVTNGRQLVQLH